MGSTGIHLGYRPRSAEVRKIVDELLAGSDEHPLVAKSGITGWTRCWAVYEPGSDPQQRYIALLQFHVSSEWFTYQYVAESMGPYEVDCPQRLLKAVDDYPPHSDIAAAWRRRAWAYHHKARDVRQLLREITRDYPHSDRRLVIRGEVVSYQRARQNGRPRHAYRKASGEVWGLRSSSVDLEATALIRAQPWNVRELATAGA